MSWIIGIQKAITWTTEDWYYADANDQVQADTVKIELSRNNGSTWETIAASAPNTGTYNWTVTGAATAQALIKLTGVNNTDTSFTSSQFAIVAQVLTTAAVSPLIGSVMPEATLQFTASGFDQDGNAMLTPPSWNWAVSGGGTISGTGLFTAGAAEGGPFNVTATVGAVVGTASVTIAKNSFFFTFFSGNK